MKRLIAVIVQAVKALVAERDQLRLTRLEDHQTIASWIISLRERKARITNE